MFVGPTLRAGREVPWILLKLPHIQVSSAAEFDGVVKALRTLCKGLDASPSHA